MSLYTDGSGVSDGASGAGTTGSYVLPAGPAHVMGWLDDHTALVTGGGSGLGLAVTRRFVDEGARVGVLDRATDRLDRVADELGDDVVTVQGDVTSEADNERAVAATAEAFDGLDVFVGNAGIFDDNVSIAELPDDIEESFVELFGVNVLGYLLGARAAMPELVANDGRMVFTASSPGSYGAGGGGILYVPSKHAVVGLIRQLAFELAPRVRVNGVAPGYVPTNLAAGETIDRDAGQLPKPEAFDPSVHPLNYRPATEDYTGAYVLLASAANSRPMTGTVIRADLGRSVRGVNEVAGRALEYVTDGLDGGDRDSDGS